LRITPIVIVLIFFVSVVVRNLVRIDVPVITESINIITSVTVPVTAAVTITAVHSTGTLALPTCYTVLTMCTPTATTTPTLTTTTSTTTMPHSSHRSRRAKLKGPQPVIPHLLLGAQPGMLQLLLHPHLLQAQLGYLPTINSHTQYLNYKMQLKYVQASKKKYTAKKVPDA
jgi:hypothetical protein